MHEFTYSSSVGDLVVNCQVMGEGDDIYWIAFKDPFTNKYKERIVSKDKVREINSSRAWN